MVMAIQTDPGRRLSEHADILTGMLGVTHLTVTLLDRFMLCCPRDIFMTSQTETFVRGM
jgi:hypothetical protein